MDILELLDMDCIHTPIGKIRHRTILKRTDCWYECYAFIDVKKNKITFFSFCPRDNASNLRRFNYLYAGRKIAKERRNLEDYTNKNIDIFSSANWEIVKP